MLDQVDTDTLLEICKYLGPRDTYVLGLVNKRLQLTMSTLGDRLLSRKRPEVYNCLSLYVIYTVSYSSSHRILHSNCNSNCNSDCNNDCNNNTSNDVHHNKTFKYRLTKNPYLNMMLTKLVDFYLQSGDQFLARYPNKIELLILYYLIQIEVYVNLKMYKTVIPFVNSLPRHKFEGMTKRYFNALVPRSDLHYEYPHWLTYNDMIIISRYTVSPTILKKLFATKVLDLSSTDLYICCEHCCETLFGDITTLRYYYSNDDLVGHNYTQIKSLLKTHERGHALIRKLEDYELSILNSHIYFTNPYDNSQVKFTSKRGLRILNDLRQNQKTIKLYNRMCQYIIKQQQKLQMLYFR